MNRWQRLGLLFLVVAAIAGGGYYAVTTGRKTGKRWTWMVPDARAKAAQLERLANQQGLNVMFWDGWRDPAETIRNIEKGTSKVKDAYGSKHTWGVAFDMVFKNPVGLPSWPPATDPRWKQLGELGKSLGLRWGGEIFGPKFFDGPHFELPNFNMQTARNAYGINYQGWLAFKGVPIPTATQTRMLA